MKKCILTMAAGSYEKIRPLIYPLFQKYAKKVGADFHSIEDIRNPDCPVLEKLRVAEYLEKYDRLLFLDADMLIRNDCPDLFEICPQGKLAAYNEGASITPAGEVEARASAIIATADFYNISIPSLPTTFFYFNSGLFVIDAQHKFLFAPPAPDPLPNPTGKLICVEQNYMNIMLLKHGTPTYHLPVCFNQMPFNRTQNYRECSYVLHYAGYPNVDSRINDMQHDLNMWKNQGLA